MNFKQEKKNKDEKENPLDWNIGYTSECYMISKNIAVQYR